MKNDKNKNPKNRLKANVIRHSVMPSGRKPVWGELEIAVTDWIKEMHANRKQVCRVLVLRKALEISPNFMGGLLDPGFSKRAMAWYYRFIHRRQYHMSIQKPTSVGQKLPEG